MLRDYVPKGQALPGVRSLEGTPWPSGPNSRHTTSISFNNGRVYIDYRRDLLSRYAARWMGSLHDHDPSAYGEMLFQLSADLAEDNASDFVKAENLSQVEIVSTKPVFYLVHLPTRKFSRDEKKLSLIGTCDASSSSANPPLFLVFLTICSPSGSS